MKQPMRILMITHHRRHRLGGRSLVMARHLAQRGHRVTIVATADYRRSGVVTSLVDGVRIIEAPDLLWGRLRSGWDVWGLLHRLRFLRTDAGPYDLVHCFETRPATIYPALDYVHRRGLPLLTDWNDWFGRGGLIDVLRPAWYRFFLGGVETYYEEAFRARGAGLTVISSALAARAQRLGVPADRICLLPGGAQPEVYGCWPAAECRAQVGLSFPGPVLGFASADSHLDMELVFSALAVVARQYPDVRLMITGTVRPAVLEMAQRQGVRGNLHLTGFLPAADLPRHLGCADIFLLPFPDLIYNVGRWPNKIGSYMSLGRPIVVNPVGDIRPLFEGSQPVGLAADYAAEPFARAVVDLIRQPELAARLGGNGRQMAETRYDWRILIQQLEAFYLQTLEREAAYA